MKLVKILLLVVMAASILGCVSSPEARKKSVDPQAAFDQHIKLAMQYIGSKSRDLARVHLQKAERFESKANRSQLYNGYALLYQMEQEMELAEKHYRKAISSNKKDRASQLTPGFAPPYLEAAEIYFEQQKLPIAKRALDQYAYLAPPSAKSLWLAVRLEHSFGNRDGASSQGLKLKNLFPYSSENLEYQKWLKQ